MSRMTEEVAAYLPVATTAEERQTWCEICEHRSPAETGGYHCSLTGELANFNVSCPTFGVDRAEVEAKGIMKTNQNHQTLRKTDKITTLLRVWSWIMLIAMLGHAFLFRLFGNMGALESLVIALGYGLVVWGCSQSLKGKSKWTLVIGLLIVVGMGLFYMALPHRYPIYTTLSGWAISIIPLLLTLWWVGAWARSRKAIG